MIQIRNSNLVARRMIAMIGISIVISIIHFSCKQHRNTRPSKKDIKYPSTNKGRVQSDIFFVNQYLENEGNELIRNYIIDSETKLGIFLNVLIDLSKYDSAKVFINDFEPNALLVYQGNFKVPYFEENLNPFIALALLKYYAYATGLDYDQAKYMFKRSFINFIDESRPEYILVRLEHSYFSVLSASSDDNITLEREYAFAQQTRKQLPKYYKAQLNTDIINLKTNKMSQNEILKVHSASGFHFESLIKFLIKRELDQPNPNKSEVDKLIGIYNSNFASCNPEVIRYYFKYSDFNSQLLLKQIDLCLKQAGSVDSVKARIYQTELFLGQNDFTNLENNLNSYFSSTQDKSFHIESDFRISELSKYEQIRLRFLLKTNRIKEYLHFVQLISSHNIIIHRISNIESLKTLTKQLYMLDQLGNANEFETFFRSYVMPEWLKATGSELG